MMYYDFTASEECVGYGEGLGFARVLCGELNVSQKPANGRINVVPSMGADGNKELLHVRNAHFVMDPVTPKSLDIDTAFLTIAEEKGIGVMLTLRAVLESKGGVRARMMHNMSEVAALVVKSGVPLVVASMAQDVYGMRPPAQLAVFGQMLGLTMPQAIWAISEAPKKALDGML